MIARPAARIYDLVLHRLPGNLMPGLPSPNVYIGGLNAWLGLPRGADGPIGDLLKSKKESQDRLDKAKAAAAVDPKLKPAYEALKVKEAAEQAAKFAAAAALTGASKHLCISVAPIPVGPPHGPGMVIDGSPTVLINKLPACRQFDEILEPFGPKDWIIMGMPNVLIGDGASSPGPLGALVNALKKLLAGVARLAERLMNMAMAAGTAALMQAAGAMGGVQAAALAAIQNLLNRGNQTLARIHENARSVGKSLAEAAASIGAAVASGDPGEIVSAVAKTAREAAQAYNHGVESVMQNAKEAARKAIQDKRDQLMEKASNLYEKGEQAWDDGMQQLDEMAKDEGIAGEMARRAREKANELAQKKRNMEAGAEKRYEQAKALREEARQGVEDARAEVAQIKEDAAQKLGELTSGVADGFNGLLDDADDHAGHSH